MKKSILLACLLLISMDRSAAAYSPEAYPGSLWTNETRDLNAVEGYGTEGKLNQGVQWLTLPGEIKFQTYGSYNWRVRTQNKRFYNTQGPALGVEFSRSFLSVGADFGWQYFPELSRTTKDFIIYTTWYKSYNWLRNVARPNILGLPIVGAPIATWGKASHDLNNLEGNATMGFITQSIEWVRLPVPTSPVLSTFAAFRWRVRSKNRPFYNEQGPTAGLALKWKHLDAGAEYAWWHHPELQGDLRNTRAFRLYLSWYSTWDLKGLKIKPAR